MPAQSSSSSLEVIQDFLAQNRIAMAGVSRDQKSFSAQLFDDLCRRGFDVVPVNPNATEINGRRCFARVQDIQPPVDAALLMTSPRATAEVVNDCIEAGIRRIWMYRATGKGAVSEAALACCCEHGVHVVPGECPYMFLPKTAWYHGVHKFIRKITGGYPQHTLFLDGHQ